MFFSVLSIFIAHLWSCPGFFVIPSVIFDMWSKSMAHVAHLNANLVIRKCRNRPPKREIVKTAKFHIKSEKRYENASLWSKNVYTYIDIAINSTCNTLLHIIDQLLQFVDHHHDCRQPAPQRTRWRREYMYYVMLGQHMCTAYFANISRPTPESYYLHSQLCRILLPACKQWHKIQELDQKNMSMSLFVRWEHDPTTQWLLEDWWMGWVYCRHSKSLYTSPSEVCPTNTTILGPSIGPSIHYAIRWWMKTTACTHARPTGLFCYIGNEVQCAARRCLTV